MRSVSVEGRSQSPRSIPAGEGTGSRPIAIDRGKGFEVSPASLPDTSREKQVHLPRASSPVAWKPAGPLESSKGEIVRRRPPATPPPCALPHPDGLDAITSTLNLHGVVARALAIGPGRTSRRLHAAPDRRADFIAMAVTRPEGLRTDLRLGTLSKCPTGAAQGSAIALGQIGGRLHRRKRM